MKTVLALDVYQPGQWHDFLIMVGGGAAALTGLVFVALSLNLNVVTQDATHRYRAIGTLAGFIAAFTTCALVLMGGQNHIAVGIEWVAVSLVAACIYVYGYIEAIRTGKSSVGLRSARLVIGTSLYGVELIGAVLIITGSLAGLYLAATSMIILLAFMISGAWLLIIGASARGSDQTGAVGHDHA